MAQPRARSGALMSARPLAEQLAGSRTQALLKATQLELIRIVLPAGKHLLEHAAPGEITVLCIEGRVRFTTPAVQHTMACGDLIHLSAGEPHALVALDDASLLLTICLAA
jgi:quercetin dioxygenase-like cupin family protein